MVQRGLAQPDCLHVQMSSLLPLIGKKLTNFAGQTFLIAPVVALVILGWFQRPVQ